MAQSSDLALKAVSVDTEIRNLDVGEEASAAWGRAEALRAELAASEKAVQEALSKLDSTLLQEEGAKWAATKAGHEVVWSKQVAEVVEGAKKPRPVETMVGVTTTKATKKPKGGGGGCCGGGKGADVVDPADVGMEVCLQAPLSVAAEGEGAGGSMQRLASRATDLPSACAPPPECMHPLLSACTLQIHAPPSACTPF